MFENKKIFIFGLARSGLEAAKLLSKYNNDILVTDRSDDDTERINALKELGIKFVKTDTPEDLLDESFDYMVKNPGIIKTHPCVLKAERLNIPVINELEVAYSFIKDKAKIIGITGSNGKTTTTTMIYEVLKQAGLSAVLAGNIGYPLCSIVDTLKQGDILVCEISDHQLINMTNFKTDISVLTNLSEVHIDFHGNYENYKNVKKRIFNNHTEKSIAILNKGNKDVLELTKDIKDKKIYFSSKKDADLYIKDNAIYYKDERIIDLKDIKIKGMHNYENVMCMIAVVKEFNVSNEIITKYLKDFGGVEHRIEFVRELHKRLFYNDSKATNTESTIVALKAFSNDTILLLGGLDRGHSFEPLNNDLKHVTHILTYGETKDRIYDWAKGLSKDVKKFENLKEALEYAYKISKENDVILLSPACASWDQYKCMEDRGNEFKSIVNSLK